MVSPSGAWFIAIGQCTGGGELDAQAAVGKRLVMTIVITDRQHHSLPAATALTDSELETHI